MSENVETFTTQVRKATRKIHSISDALVNAKFALSLRDEKVWGGGLFVFYHVFSYLEDARIRLKNSEFDSLFVNKILFRKEAFEQDLEHYLGKEWHSLEKSEALNKYLQHLEVLERDNPQMLMAYVYHLYLGLLSGGQILAKKRKLFGNKGNQDVYIDKVTDFSGVDVLNMKTEFREAMNRIAENMTSEQKQTFIDESNRVFLLNNSIVNSVGGQNRVVCTLLYKITAVAVVIIGISVAYKLYK